MDGDLELDFICERCQTGHLQLRRVTLADWMGDAFVTVPNFPAWVCDVCGHREYDAEALEHLQAVLGPQAALRRHRTAVRPGGAVPRAAHRPSGRHFV